MQACCLEGAALDLCTLLLFALKGQVQGGPVD